MPRFQVSSTAQNVAQGLQGPVTLANDGNATIYLDNNASVNTDSYPLPPLATIAWDADLPLWVRTEGTSTSRLNMIFNSVPANASRSNVHQLIYAAPNPNPALGVWSIEDIDCSVYETLVFRMDINAAISQVPQLDEMMEIVFEWSDDAGNALKNEIFWTPNTFGSDIIMAIPVKGGRFDINMFGHSLEDMPVGIKIYGLTRKIRPYVFPFQFFCAVASPVIAFRDGVMVEGFTTLDQCWLPNLGSRLQVMYRTSASVTTAGDLIVNDGGALQDVYAQAPIPVTTGAGYFALECIVPISRPILVRIAGMVGGGTGRLTCTFADTDISN
jgi:hypothetical protein